MSLMKRLKATLGDPYAKGDLFEEFVADMFPDEYFSIVHKTMSVDDLKGRGSESCVNPDYQFRDRDTKETFWVECKYRSDTLHDGSVQWSEFPQMKRYRDIRERTRMKIYLVLGIGGRPTNPAELYIMDLDKVRFPRLFRSAYRPFVVLDLPFRSVEDIKRIV